MGHYGSHDFSLFATFSATQFFDTFWSPLDSLWPPLGLQVPHLWLPFGSLLQPFGSLWVPFGFLWFTFGTLFEEIMKTFINSIHFHEFARLANNFYEFSCFSRPISEENSQQPDPRTPQPLLDPPLPPGTERNLAVGNFDRKDIVV